jgi:hypothetical protein
MYKEIRTPQIYMLNIHFRHPVIREGHCYYLDHAKMPERIVPEALLLGCGNSIYQ